MNILQEDATNKRYLRKAKAKHRHEFPQWLEMRIKRGKVLLVTCYVIY